LDNNQKKERSFPKFIAFVYPYLLYHLYILFNWFEWSVVPLEISTYSLILVLICTEYVLFLVSRKGGEERRGYGSFLTSTFFLVFPLIFIVFGVKIRLFVWFRWFMAFFYINHAVLLDYSLLGMLLLGLASIAVAAIFYFFIVRRPKVIFGLYLPWFIFMSPLLAKYLVGGALGGEVDIKKYKYLESVVNPLDSVGSSPYITATPAPRGLYIENDTIYTAYETTIYASPAERLFFEYNMDTKRLAALGLPGMGVRRIFSRPTDPYIYISIWKWNPGFFRVNKKRPRELDCLIDLHVLDRSGGTIIAKGLEKIYQIGNMYVDTKGDAAYLLNDSYPAIGKYHINTRALEILDLTKQGYCPIGSILGFMPAVDPEEKYMYSALTNCYCGVVRIDMERLNVDGCYEIKSPRQGFYGVIFYKDGLLYCFPVVKYYKTLVLDAESMEKVKEFDKPPFHYIRDVIELDSEHLLCLGFFGDLAVFNMKTGEYTTLIRKDLSFAMGLFKYGDYIYFNTAQHGILRVNIEKLLALAKDS